MSPGRDCCRHFDVGWRLQYPSSRIQPWRTATEHGVPITTENRRVPIDRQKFFHKLTHKLTLVTSAPHLIALTQILHACSWAHRALRSICKVGKKSRYHCKPAMAGAPPPTAWQGGNDYKSPSSPSFSSPRTASRVTARPADLDTASAAWKHVSRIAGADNKQTDLFDLLQSSARESQYSFQPPGVRDSADHHADNQLDRSDGEALTVICAAGAVPSLAAQCH